MKTKNKMKGFREQMLDRQGPSVQLGYFRREKSKCQATENMDHTPIFSFIGKESVYSFNAMIRFPVCNGHTDVLQDWIITRVHLELTTV